MRKYPQVAIQQPTTTLLVWLAIIGIGAVFALLWPGIELAPYLDRSTAMRDMLGDMKVFGAGAALLLAVLVLVGFRAVQSLVFILLVGAVAVATSYGFMGLTGTRVTMPTSWLLLFAVAIGAEYAIFVGYSYINQCVHELTRGRELRDPRFMLSEGVRTGLNSIVAASVATSIAFLMMLASDSPELGDMGLVLVVATLVSAFAAVWIVPAVIASAPWKVDLARENKHPLHKLADAMGRGAASAPKKVFAVFGLLLAAGAVGMARHSFEGGVTDVFTGIGVTAVILWLLMTIVFRSARTGLLIMTPKIAAFVLMFGVLGWLDHPLEPIAVLTGLVVLAISLGSTIHFFADWRFFTSYDRLSAGEATQATMRKSGKPIFLAAATRALAGVVLMFSSYDVIVWLGAMMSIASVSTLVCDFALVPALMSWVKPRFPMPSQEELDNTVSYDNTVMDPAKPMDDYTDQEIWDMHVYDFFSVSGKIVIRVGALYGTRRLIYEMNIKPGSKVLEVGSGRGATAFYLAKHLGCHVTCTDLSEYFLTLAKDAAEAHGVLDRMDFVVGEEGRLAFEDNTFDVVLTEAVTMYTSTEFVFKEAYRVLKPGGVLGSHEWSWPDAEVSCMSGLVNNIACCCDQDGVTMYTMDGWHAQLEYHGFQVEYIEQFPFKYFSVLGLTDDESLIPVMKIFGRILNRKEATKKLLSIVMFLDKYQHAFTYTLSVNRKPLNALPAPADDDAAGPRLAEASAPTENAADDAAARASI